VVSRHKGPVREGGCGNFPPLTRSEWSKQYGHLWDFIVDDRYDDGTERLPGTFLLCTGEGRIRVWLHDRDQALSAWFSGATVEDALRSADSALGTATVEWRRAKSFSSASPNNH